MRSEVSEGHTEFSIDLFEMFVMTRKPQLTQQAMILED